MYCTYTFFITFKIIFFEHCIIIKTFLTYIYILQIIKGKMTEKKIMKSNKKNLEDMQFETTSDSASFNTIKMEEYKTNKGKSLVVLDFKLWYRIIISLLLILVGIPSFSITFLISIGPTLTSVCQYVEL